MALTDAERIQMTAIALMNHNVIYKGGKSNAIIYDIAQITESNPTYTAPVGGTVFYIGDYRTNTTLPTGFTVVVSKNFSYERLADSLAVKYCQLIIAKKSISQAETITFSLNGISGICLLAEAGSCVSSSSFGKIYSALGSETATFTFDNPDNFTGLGFFGYIISSPNWDVVETATSKLKYNCITNGINNARGVAVNLPTTDHTITMNAASGGGMSAALLRVALAASGSDSTDTENVGISIDNEVVLDFVAGSHTYTAKITGYAIFAGGYRSADGFKLNGFTVLHTNTRTIGDVAQSEVIAYKAVTKGETVSWTSADRSGGVFYETHDDISSKSYTKGKATKGTSQITFPMVQENHNLFGIIGFIVSYSTVSAPVNSSELRYTQSATVKRLTTFSAVDFIAVSGEDNIAFNYTDGDGYPGDCEGIWVEFSN